MTATVDRTEQATATPVRAALVLGATGDIGGALATALMNAGFALTVSGRNPSGLDAVRQRLSERGTPVAAIAADLTDEPMADAVVDRHLADFGRLDVLLIATGTSRFQRLSDPGPIKSRTLLETNVTSVIRVVHAALPALRRSAAAGGPALVVLLGSVVAHRPAAGYAVYSASKAALVSVARSINLEQGAYGVRATAICPGFVDTRMTAPLRGRMSPMLPVADVVECLLFLLRLSPGACVDIVELARTGVEAGSP